MPGISALSIATRYIEGGRERFIEFVQMAALDAVAEAQSFLIVFADLTPVERARVSLDDVCAACGVSPSALVGKVVSVAMQHAIDVGNFVAATMHPSIVHQAGRSAKRIGGAHAGIAQRDREMIFQHHGFVPMPRGQSIHVHANASAASTAAAASQSTAADPSVPSFADTMSALRGPRAAVQQQLIEARPMDALDDPLSSDDIIESVPVEIER